MGKLNYTLERPKKKKIKQRSLRNCHSPKEPGDMMSKYNILNGILDEIPGGYQGNLNKIWPLVDNNVSILIHVL